VRKSSDPPSIKKMENPYDPIEEAGPTPDGIQDCSPTPRYEGDQQFPAAAAAEEKAVQQQQQLGLELDSPRRSESSSVRIVGDFPGVGRSEPKPPAAKRRKIEDGVAGVGKGHDQAARKTPVAGGKQEVLRSSSSNKATTVGAPASSNRAQPSMLCSLLQKNTKWKPGRGRAETSKPPPSTARNGNIGPPRTDRPGLVSLSTGNANPGLSKTSASTSAGEGALPRASSGAGVAAAEPPSSVPPALSSAAPARAQPQRPTSTTNDEIILLDESDDEEQEQLQVQQPATSIGVQVEQKMREEILKLQRVSKYWRGTTKGPHQDLSDEKLPNYVTVIRNALPEAVSLRLLRMVLYGDLGKNFEEKDWWVFGRKGKTPRKTYVYNWNGDHDHVEPGREENKSGVVLGGEAVAGASSRGDGKNVPTSSPAMRRAFETVEGLVNRHLGQYLQKTPYPLLKKYPPPRSWKASYALGNWYRDGADNVGPHQDSLTHLGPCPIIASLSLGAGREFVIERRGGGAGGATGTSAATSNGIASANPPAEKLSLMLLHGDVLIMWPGVQEEFTHSVPKMANPLPFSLSRGGREVADRINWTFRMEREEYFRLTPRCDCRVGVVAPVSSTTATAGADGGSSSSSRGEKDKENVLAKKKLLGREQVEGPREQDEGGAIKNNTTVTDHVLENRLCNLKPMVQNWGGANFGKYLYRCNPADRSEKPCKFLQVAPWSLLEGGLEEYLSRGAGAGGGAD